MAIEFYLTQDAYGEFSNFSPYGIEMDGKWYPTSEHYFQAQKFEDEEYREKIREAKSPMIAAGAEQIGKTAQRLGKRKARCNVGRSEKEVHDALSAD